ncbi:hypothetical protein [Schaalia hyovaginalis]|uniref:Uncharacterized protein n=1 Tax=Schaalia hyovaginalis TaxID=29316 RepID=A0A923E6X2_9ACTO|nr:hypothetical protein [Schaalia hyovaginalis]MBB6335790.1 hypothetical protein [Schaalia hyovaginalis]
MSDGIIIEMLLLGEVLALEVWAIIGLVRRWNRTRWRPWSVLSQREQCILILGWIIGALVVMIGVAYLPADSAHRALAWISRAEVLIGLVFMTCMVLRGPRGVSDPRA